MEEGRSKIIVIANQKGGVGKTTTAINLSFSLTLLSRRVLIVDLDSQGNATSGLGVEFPEISPLSKLKDKDPNLRDGVLKTPFNNLDIIPGGPSILDFEYSLLSVPKRESLLSKALQPLKSSYDYIVLDCPPNLGIMTLNALVAGDSVIIPLQCEYFALEGLGNLLSTIRKVRRYFNPTLFVMGILLTMYDGRNRLSREVEREIRKLLPDKVFKTIIPRNVRLGEAPSHGVPAYIHDKRSKGAISYLHLAEEVIKKNGSQ